MISAMRTFVNQDKTVVNGPQTLPSNEAVREAITDYVLTLEPKLRCLNTFVSVRSLGNSSCCSIR
jgi:hypothetical protein